MDRPREHRFRQDEMLDNLKSSEVAYGFGTGIFFLGYFLFGVPSNLPLTRIGSRRTITRFTIGWGVTSNLMMVVKTTTAFYALRFLLGAFEAGFYPGVILYLTYWYPTSRRAQPFGLFHVRVGFRRRHAQLFARELDGLSVLGQRTGRVTRAE